MKKNGNRCFLAPRDIRSGYEYDCYGVEQYCWWLREPVEGTSSKCYMVGNGYYEENIWTKNVGLEGFGVRPAITVDLQADCISGEK